MGLLFWLLGVGVCQVGFSSAFQQGTYSSALRDGEPNFSPSFQEDVPQGMTPSLVRTLLRQEPHVFEGGASQPTPASFNVGYSIGLERTPHSQVVMGRPKGRSLEPVRGEETVWKELGGGVEMSVPRRERAPPPWWPVSTLFLPATGRVVRALVVPLEMAAPVFPS